MEKKGNFQGKKTREKIKLQLSFKKWWLVFLPLLLLFPYLLYLIFYYQRIYPFVRVAHLNLAGLNRSQASQFLKEAINQKQISSLNLIYNQQTWSIPLNELNFRYLPEVSSQKAFAVGRHQNLNQNFYEQILAFWQRINLDLSYELEEARLEAEIASISAQIDLEAIPPLIQVLDEAEAKNGERIIISEGKPGRKLDQEKIKALIKNQLGQLETEELNLPIAITSPTLSQQILKETKARAEKLLGKKIILTFKEETWELTDKEIINFLSFYQAWDEEKIATYIEALLPSLNRPAQDALFRFENGRVIEFKPAIAGQNLDKNKTQQLLVEALRSLEEETNRQVAKINLPVSLIAAKITTSQVNNLGIQELLGEGNSWFYGSIAGRIHNIQLAASKINGLLVAPEEIFSFNEAVGDVSASTGFKQAYIIQGNRTVLGDGGGVCQVSTTLFRAILSAGLPVEERHAHAYRVSYYEYNSEPGFDATVYYPSEDLKFKNDTPAHLLIQTTTDLNKMKLTIQLYGTPDGRKVKISKARIWDQVPPPPDLYQEDPTLPAGTLKQIDFRAWGAKVAFDWQVTRNSEVLQDKTFYSQYRPWQAIFLKGTSQ